MAENSERGKNVLHIKLEGEGCYHAVVTCQGKSIVNGIFDIVSLNRKSLRNNHCVLFSSIDFNLTGQFHLKA